MCKRANVRKENPAWWQSVVKHIANPWKCCPWYTEKEGVLKEEGILEFRMENNEIVWHDRKLQVALTAY